MKFPVFPEKGCLSFDGALWGGETDVTLISTACQSPLFREVVTVLDPDRFQNSLNRIRPRFQGDLLTDELDRTVYSTDASVYQQMPIAVARPRVDEDIRLLIELARENSIGLIPRAAGTSLAGQVVGSGIIVDISRYYTRILEIDPQNGWVRVQPGVIRDELNLALASHGLFFAPETSTSNRAMIGGMLGNNSCGANSIVYGTTRDQTLEVEGFLGDGSKAAFAEIDSEQLKELLIDPSPSFATNVIRQTYDLLNHEETKKQIRNGFPRPAVTRRNTGYAIDQLIEAAPLGGTRGGLNLCQLIAGSEGTLFFATEIKLRCHPIPPTHSVLLCPHFESIDQALRATQIIMQTGQPSGVEHNHGQPVSNKIDGELFSGAVVLGCELIDRLVLEGAARNTGQKGNADFVVGDPAAILMVDIRCLRRSAIDSLVDDIREALKNAGLGYAFPAFGDDAARPIWKLRKAGLGVVANISGDTKPVTVIEDAAVAVEDLAAFVVKVDQRLSTRFKTRCVHYGHAGAGELHLRPMVNLKTRQGVDQFRQIATEVASMVKEFGGSLSGEHGDGRLRGEFLCDMIGTDNYELLREIKRIWDPDNVFNPGKIIDSPPMTDDLRYRAEQPDKVLPSVFDFGEVGGLQQAAEMCSGSGDCRKTHLTGGVMCPSYMATRNENDTTRARANVLRQVLTDGDTVDTLNDPRLRKVMDLCLSCKGCKLECPSNVDVAKMKAEFLHSYYRSNGIPRRARWIARHARMNGWAGKLPRLSNWLSSSRMTTGFIKRYLGFHPHRSLPKLHRTTLRGWYRRHLPHPQSGAAGKVLFFCDEFTNYLDVPVGIAAIQVLERLGYSVIIPKHVESGRAAISQGLLDHARQVAEENVRLLGKAVEDNHCPLIGVEPSALLTLRDEYPALVNNRLRKLAGTLAEQTYLIDEFISELMGRSIVSSDLFTDRTQSIRLHGHCHQKALSSMKSTIRMLQMPARYQVRMIPAGCCGMAGAFGFEKEHFDISMQIGELILFPTIRKEAAGTIIAAGGTSCRHQILDGTGRIARHPVEILRDAFLDP